MQSIAVWYRTKDDSIGSYRFDNFWKNDKTLQLRTRKKRDSLPDSKLIAE